MVLEQDSAAELDRLERQVRAMTRERMDIERGLSNPAALRSATARAYRDRDAVTSPLLEEARAQIESDVHEFHAQWRLVDRIPRGMERLAAFLADAPEAIRAHHDGIAAELPGALTCRGEIGDTLARSGLHAVLPDGDGNNE